MSGDVPDLKGGHGQTVAFIVGPLLAAIILVGGIVWQAAQYPSRAEFNAVRDKFEAISQDVAVVRARLEALTQGAVDIKGQQQRIETKLDDLTERRRR